MKLSLLIFFEILHGKQPIKFGFVRNGDPLNKVAGFPLNFLIQFYKEVVFPLNVGNDLTNFKRDFNFSQECYYLENKVGVVDFAKGQGLVKF